jgi:secretion/DNA translocation related TadE-like protein
VSMDREAGSATVWALIVVLAVWVAAALAVIETDVIQARHEASAIADAVALAGASDGGLDPVAACASARDVASAHRARLLSCLVAGPLVTVEVSVPSPAAIDWAGRVTARARAGPANTGDSEGT